MSCIIENYFYFARSLLPLGGGVAGHEGLGLFEERWEDATPEERKELCVSSFIR